LVSKHRRRHFLATTASSSEYWQKLAKEKRPHELVEIGKSEEGRPHGWRSFTVARNHKKLARWKEISRKLALGEGLSDDDAKKLPRKGKAVVWIDGDCMRAKCGAQQLMESLYTFLTRTSPETMRILDSVGSFWCQANPDGQELVTSSYMTRGAGQARLRSYAPVPEVHRARQQSRFLHVDAVRNHH